MRSPEAEAEIRTLVTAFYARVREDDLLGPLEPRAVAAGGPAS